MSRYESNILNVNRCSYLTDYKFALRCQIDNSELSAEELKNYCKGKPEKCPKLDDDSPQKQKLYSK